MAASAERLNTGVQKPFIEENLKEDIGERHINYSLKPSGTQPSHSPPPEGQRHKVKVKHKDILLSTFAVSCYRPLKMSLKVSGYCPKAIVSLVWNTKVSETSHP